MHIAVIDDSQFMRSLIVKALNQLQPQACVTEFSDPEEAVRALPALQPDLITLDLLMPGLHGFEVLDQLARLPIRPRIIVITADVQDTVRQRCLAAGVIAFVEKPLTLEKLRVALTNLLPS